MARLQKYAESFELSPVAHLLVSPAGIIEVANQEFEKLFEYARGELIGEPVECLLPEVFRHSHPALRNSYFERPTKTQMGQGRDLEGVTRTGRRVPVELGLEPIVDQGERWVLVTAIDATERHQSQALVRASLDAAASAMIMVASDGSIVSANRSAHSLFGYGNGELSGQSIDLLVPQNVQHDHGAYRKQFFAASRRRSMGTGQPIYGLHKSGAEFRVEAALTPVEVSGRKLVLATIVDLSERLAAERALAAQHAAEAQAEHLNRMNKSLTEFAYSVSHDLKAPMSTMTGMLGLCLEDLAAGKVSEVAENLKKLRDMSTRSANKIESVLKLARVGNEPYQLQAIDLDELIRQLWRDLTINENKRPEFKVAIDLAEPFVGSPQIMEIVMDNLLSNAVKYCDSSKAENWVTVTARHEREWIEIIVADNGIGIAQSQLEEVFSAFKRLTNRVGDGLGLAIVRRYVGVLGGTVTASSNLNDGTRFTLRLPQNPRVV